MQNTKKNKSERRKRHPLPVVGQLPRGRGIRNYVNNTFCKEKACTLSTVHGSTRCVEHSGKRDNNN